MAYKTRLRLAFHHPSRCLQEVLDKPSFLKTSVVMMVASVASSIIAEYGMFHSVGAHFTAAYSLMFTILWFLPTLLSMLLFRAIGKHFDTESYMEANALSFLPVLTVVFVCLCAFMIYSNAYAQPRRTAYFAMVYYNQWLPMALAGALGVVVLVHRLLVTGRLIAQAKAYQIALVWSIAAAISLYIAYLLFRGWL